MIRAFIKFVLKLGNLILFRVKVVRTRKYWERSRIYPMSKPYK